MLIIPAIDLRQGCCVRLTQGRREAAKVYDNDPLAVALGFQNEGAQMLHLVDLDGAFSGPSSLSRQVLRNILGAVDIPVQFGGGLRTIDDIKEIIQFGVTRVVIGTLAAESPNSLKTLVDLFGNQIAVGIDAKAGKVLTRGWEQATELAALEFAQRVAELGVERIVYTDVSRDGMLTGLNVAETCRIGLETGLKVTASGGVSSLEDLKSLKSVSDCGIDSVIVGKALYEKRFSIAEALKI